MNGIAIKIILILLTIVVTLLSLMSLFIKKVLGNLIISFFLDTNVSFMILSL